MTLRLVLLLCLALSGGGPARADSTVYRYVDRDGTVTFTNLPLPGAVPFGPAASRTPKRSGDTRIAPGTQQRRDLTRRQILLQELDNERKALASAQSALKRRPGRTDPALQAAVTEHEKNIAAISTELVH